MIYSFKIKNIALLFTLLVFTNNCFAQFGAEGTAVSLTISPKLCPAGQPVLLKGNILVNDKAQSYTIRITEPGGLPKIISGQTDIKGDYNKTFAETQSNGWYTVETVAADNKGKITDSFFVSSPQGVVMAFQNRINALLTQSVRNINQSLGYLEQMPASNGLEETREKLRTAITRMGEIKQKTSEANTHFNKLMQEIQTLPPAQQAMQRHHEVLSQWTQQADEVLPRMDQQQQQYQNISNSCEAINAVVELCGLVSWIMNFQGGLAKVMVNIASDKVLPGAVDRVEWTGSDEAKEAKKFAINEAQKGMTAAYMGINDVIGAAPNNTPGAGAMRGGITGMVDFIKTGLIGDALQFVSKVLYAQKCVDLKGPANAQFNAEMFNKGRMYWSYGVQYKGTLTLRYEKTADLSKAVEISGEFEGYKAKYDFWEKVENVEPVPASLKIIKRIVRKPTVINASSIGNDLGLAGRTLTPGMYRVKVKGKLLDNKLTLEVIRSPLDLTERVEANVLYLVMINTALPFPMVKSFPFAIAKSRAAFVVGLGDQYELPLQQEQEKLKLQKTFTNSRTMGTSGDIKLETKMDINLSN